MAFLGGWLILVFVAVGWSYAGAQEKFEAPSLNIGDEWTYKNEAGGKWKQKVIAEDRSCYLIKYGKGIQGYDKRTMNIVFTVDQNGKRTKFTGIRGKVLNFPLFIGKKWSIMTRHGLEEYFVSSSEEIETAAGKFKAIRIEYTQKRTQQSKKTHSYSWTESSLGTYWYAPEAKAIVKRAAQNLFTGIEEVRSIPDMELVSYGFK